MRRVLLALVSLTLLGGSGAALGQMPLPKDCLPLSQVRAGMTGYGLTVFHGTKIERFSVTVVSVVRRGSLVAPGHDMILVRLSGGPMTTRSAPLIRGMSGSPIYLNGKLAGAFSQGEYTTREPLGGVTPIEDMFDALDPRLPVAPWTDPGTDPVELPTPVSVGSRTIRRIVVLRTRSAAYPVQRDTAVLHPCAAVLTTTGISTRGRKRLAALLEPYGVDVAQSQAGGGATAPGPGKPSLAPGAAMAVMLMTGDFTSGATGTVTYRDGARLLGFGHPFLAIGPLEAPLCSAYVHDVYPLTSGSYKITSPGAVAGRTTQDRLFAVAGSVGQMPRMIPVTIDVTDRTTGIGRVFHASVVTHPNLFGGLVSLAAGSAIDEIRGFPGAATATVETTIEAEQVGRIVRINRYYDARGIAGSATADLDEALAMLAQNPFRPLALRSASLKVVIEEGRRTAQVERIFVRKARYEPGESAEIGVQIRPYNRPPVTRTLSIPLPPDLPDCRLALTVRGGAPPAPLSIGGITIRPQAPQTSDLAPPASAPQMFRRFLERDRSTEVVLRVSLPTAGINVDGRTIADLPSYLEAPMRSSRSSVVRTDRDELRVALDTQWVVSGSQTVSITVQGRTAREPAGSSPGSPTPATSGIAPLPGPPTGAGDDAADISAPLPRGEWMSALGEPVGQRASRSPQPRSRSTRKAPPVGESVSRSPVSSPSPSTPSAPPLAGRAPLVWRQSARSDFSRGRLSGVAVSSAGDLRLTTRVSQRTSTGETWAWCVTRDGDGATLMGTGPCGRIMRVDASGKSALHAALPEVNVYSLLRAANGTLFAGTGPDGRIYRIGTDGVAREFARLAEHNVLALAVASDGALYAGVGGRRARIYRIATDGAARVLAEPPADYVTSLAVAADGRLLAGTSGPGLVIACSPEGKLAAEWDVADQSVTGLAQSGGAIWATTSPKGTLQRMTAEGQTSAVIERTPGGLLSVASLEDGGVAICGSSGAWLVSPAGVSLPLELPTGVEPSCISGGSATTLQIGSSNGADLLRPGLAQTPRSGEFISVAHDARAISRWGTVRWSAETPAGSGLAFACRSGATAEPDATWSTWRDLSGGSSSPSAAPCPSSRFVQIRARLTSSDPAASPVLREVSLSFLPRNQAPRAAFQAPVAFDAWSGSQTVRWEASDPDRDTLSFMLECSSDGGKSWLAAPAATAPASAPPPPAPAAVTPISAQAAAAAPKRPRPPSVADVEAQVDKHPELPAGLRDAILKRARDVNAAWEAEQGGAPVTVPNTASPAISSAETMRTIDTRTMADGVWRFRVTASDRPSNAVDPMVATAVSEPVIICNAAPTLVLLQTDDGWATTDRRVRIEGVVLQQIATVAGVMFRVDGGEWLAALAVDGIFDDNVERFVVETAPLPVGRHTVEIRAYSGSKSTSLETVQVEIK